MNSSNTLKAEVEDIRRRRAQVRRNYGNLVSTMNVNHMRQKQKALAEQTPATVAPPSPHQENSLRRIASSFAHVADLQSGCCDALPAEDTEQDVKEERAEVLIRSQTMPMPMPMQVPVNETPLAMVVPTKVDLPLSPKKKQEEDEDDSESRLAKILPYTLQQESRATERWLRVSSTVSALFRARRNIDVEESPMAQTRRLREQRELLESFTRPFLYDPEMGAHSKAQDPSTHH